MSKKESKSSGKWLSRKGESTARVRGNCQNHCLVSWEDRRQLFRIHQHSELQESEGFQCMHAVGDEH